MKTSAIRKSAQGQECQIRIPGVCNFNPETTVLCHLSGGGWSRKAPDYMAAYGCSSCHDAIDGRSKTPYTKLELDEMHLRGVMRTQSILVELGLMTYKGI